METWFHVNYWSQEIEPREVIRVTPKFVTYIDPRYAKTERRESRDDYFPTWEEAKAAIILHHSNKAKQYEAQARAEHQKVLKAERLVAPAPKGVGG